MHRPVVARNHIFPRSVMPSAITNRYEVVTYSAPRQKRKSKKDEDMTQLSIRAAPQRKAPVSAPKRSRAFRLAGSRVPQKNPITIAMASAAREYPPQSPENKKLRTTRIEAVPAFQPTPASESHSPCTKSVIMVQTLTESTDLLLPGPQKIAIQRM